MAIELDNLQNPNAERQKDNYQNVDYNKSENDSYRANQSNEIERNKDADEEYENLSLEELVNKAKSLLDQYPVDKIRIHFQHIKDVFRQKIESEIVLKKEKFIAAGGNEIDFRYQDNNRSNFNDIYSLFKTKLNSYYKDNEKKENENLEKRLEIIEELKALYQDSNDSTAGLFKKFRELKTRWHNAGRVPGKDADHVFKNYFFHLDNFYSYLDLNKELQSLDYDHNLQVRQSIIKRAEELVNESNVQKALNELQYLHILWKEEAVPVAEEFREETWQRFKELTNTIHERKNELNEKIKIDQQKNLILKQDIITEIETVVSESSIPRTHSQWQKYIKDIDKLREKFLTIGRVPKEFNTEIWEKFKTTTRNFNHLKNEFYKNLKNEQQHNLQKKIALLKLAKDHQFSTDWDNSVLVIKKIQNEWKSIGHVPRKNSDKIWKDFREACNSFFDRYKSRFEESEEKLKTNLEAKNILLQKIEDFKLSETKETDIEELQKIQNKWNEIGNVPQENKIIDKDFNQLFNQKLNDLQLTDKEIIDLRLKIFAEQIKKSGNKQLLDDEIRKTRKQIEELEKEINQLENNVNFFANADENNPLLKDVYKQITNKREQLTNAEIKLRTLFSIKF